MKKSCKYVGIIVMMMIIGFSFAACNMGGDDGGNLITVGIINNPASESAYRFANDKDMKDVFTEANGYDASFKYGTTLQEHLAAFNEFVEDGVDYILLSPASYDGWNDALQSAKNAGIKVFLFDRMVTAPQDLYEAAVVSSTAEEGKTAVSLLKSADLPEYNVIHIQGVMGTDAQIGRGAALDAEFAAGRMNKVVQQTANWSADEAKTIVESVIEAGTSFNIIYAENDSMAFGAVEALDDAGITHGVDGEVVILGFNNEKRALRELLAGRWNYDVQCSPFQAKLVEDMIRTGNIPSKVVINPEKGFDAKTITQADVDTYGIGD
ncbi:MAG: substrate-binding domain-containing protein [Treponema sp.]|jgi:simple sugar transport system substrate-binding protein|nr:substrate-binding domain-containing protein [Treponema sp.]